MAEGILLEDWDGLTEMAKRPEFCRGRGGRPLHRETLARWHREGVRTPAGTVKLEAALYGARLITSAQAVRRFIERVNQARRLGRVASR